MIEIAIDFAQGFMIAAILTLVILWGFAAIRLTTGIAMGRELSRMDKIVVGAPALFLFIFVCYAIGTTF